MSWTIIQSLLAALGTGAAAVGTGALAAGKALGTGAATVGKAALPVAKFAGETLLGDLPRFGAETPGGGTPITQFTGDLLGSLGNPKGLLGQAARVAMVAGGFGQSPQVGMAILDILNKGDIAQSAKLQRASALGQTPSEYEFINRERVPGGTSLIPTDLAPGGPSAPERAISFPTDPKIMEEALLDQFKAQRVSPNYGVGASPEENAALAAREQRTGQPSDFIRNFAAYQAMQEKTGGFDPGLYKSTFGVGPEGIKAGYSALDAFEQSHTLDVIDRMEVPENYRKVILPDETNPGRAYVKVVNTKTGRDLYDIIHGAAAGDTQSQAEMQILTDFYQGKRAGDKLGSMGEEIKRAALEMKMDPNDLTISDIQILDNAMKYKPEAMFQIEGSTIKPKSSGEVMDEAKAEIMKRHGAIKVEEAPKGPIEPNSLSEMLTSKKQLGEGVAMTTTNPKKGLKKAGEGLLKQLKLASGSKMEKMKVLAEILAESELTPEEQTKIMIMIDEAL